MDNLALQCQCGTVRGRAIRVYPVDGTRVVCYCRDCQAFAHALNAAERVLDAQGGTDIYQLPPARLQIHQGHDQIRCLRLSSKGCTAGMQAAATRQSAIRSDPGFHWSG